MTVDFDIFEKLEVFARGDIIGTRCKRPWYYFGKPHKVQVPIYQRLVVIAKLKDAAELPRVGQHQRGLPEDIQGHSQDGPGNAAAGGACRCQAFKS